MGLIHDRIEVLEEGVFSLQYEILCKKLAYYQKLPIVPELRERLDYISKRLNYVKEVSDILFNDQNGTK